MTEKEELFLKWFDDNRESMHVNLSTVGGLRLAFFGGLEAAQQKKQTECLVCFGRGFNVDWNKNHVQCSTCKGTGKNAPRDS